MTKHDTSEETRSRMANTVAGKAKEFAGAVTGNDELTEEGRLRQQEAKAQREAADREAQAEAGHTEAKRERDEALENRLDAKREADAEAVEDKIDILNR